MTNLVDIMTVVLPLLTGALMPLLIIYVKRNLHTADKLIDQRFVSLSQLIEERHRNWTVQFSKTEKTLTEYMDSLERIRDRWDNFLREYLKADSTRGNKIDAMFRVLDTTNENLRQVREEVNQLKGLTKSFHELQIRIVTLETLQKGVHK